VAVSWTETRKNVLAEFPGIYRFAVRECAKSLYDPTAIDAVRYTFPSRF
jgi:hypothetical protein